mmetsp:Transcript_21751/g.20875  ORF Transcript_21751/g.20875 Transcript_21751/m.20875 type:complete len:86 (-) Transcript_21751:375-632(-)
MIQRYKPLRMKKKKLTMRHLIRKLAYKHLPRLEDLKLPASLKALHLWLPNKKNLQNLNLKLRKHHLSLLKKSLPNRQMIRLLVVK